MSDLEIDKFISRLYQSTPDIDIGHYRNWALRELAGLIDFDACIWSTGHLSTRTFHTHNLIGLPDDFHQRLIESLPINPISKQLFSRPDEPVNMSDVVEDSTFYQSEIYHTVFKPVRIERILSAIHIDQRSGIYTLLSLYRSDREKNFSLSEKSTHQRMLYHLINAASMASFASMAAPARDLSTSYAICDKHGVYHAVEESFLDLVEDAFPEHDAQQLPFTIPQGPLQVVLRDLVIKQEAIGDLFRIILRPSSAIDTLTDREREVVAGVTQGMSFKQIAKRLALSPSTVSNHLYRVYQKLRINNRAELADLINTQRAAPSVLETKRT